MSGDTWGYLTLGALGIGGGVLWRRFRTRHPVAPRPDRPAYRRLDVVTITCEHLDHHYNQIPTATVGLANLVRDVRALRRLGWGGNDHTNVCRYHNPDSYIPLDKLHVACSSDTNCGERDTISTEYGGGGFGKLRNAGWVNVVGTADVACPYCSGRRRRPRW